MDYEDQDDLYRLNSMEREGYAKLGLPPPSNLPLVTPMELLRIPGWREALAGMSGRGINATITTEATTLINVNTAPAEVLVDRGDGSILTGRFTALADDDLLAWRI